MDFSGNPDLFIINNVQQNGEKGLLSVRATDGAPFFLPGNWNVQFSKNYLFAFSEQKLNILTESTINTISLSDQDAEISSVETNTQETLLAIVSNKNTSSRICIIPLIQASQSDCLTVDINKLSETRWDPEIEGVLIVKTSDNLLYTYTVENKKMHAVVIDNEPVKLKELNSLFENTTKEPKSNRLFLTMLFNISNTHPQIFRVSAKTERAIQLDDNHILLKEKNALRVLETDTKFIATIHETKNIDKALILFPYGSEVFVF